MSLILDGTNGLSDVDGTAAAPAIRGTDANTGIFFPAADTIGFAEGGTEVMRIDSSGNLLVGTTTAQTGAKLAVTGGIQGTIASGTAVASTSGTSIDFTSIPSWVKRITVMFNGVSLSGTSNILIQIGSGSIVTTGYNSSTGTVVNAAASSGATSTAGFIEAVGAAANVICGQAIISNISANLWVSNHSHGFTNAAAASCGGGISPSLSGALDRVRITTVNGTDTFDAGTINILYEG